MFRLKFLLPSSGNFSDLKFWNFCAKNFIIRGFDFFPEGIKNVETFEKFPEDGAENLVESHSSKSCQ